jgi:excinuclease ABC subunit C
MIVPMPLLRSTGGCELLRQRALLKHFGSLKKIKAASLAELQAMPGLPRSIAEQVYRYFHPEANI